MQIRSLPSLRAWATGLLLVMLIGMRPARAAEAPIAVPSGAGSFTFIDAKGDPGKPMTVYTYLPEGLQASEARIVFVLHGHGGNAKGYRDRWGVQAEKYRFMVVAPLFDTAHWGGGDYSYASVMSRNGQTEDPSKWSFNVVEHLFDAVRQATGNTAERYFIYGHSEGGQFVHRLVLLLPQARYQRAVVANPGWYTMPRFDVRYPYGLEGAPASESTLKTVLQRDVVLMLGDRDNDPMHPQLRKTAEAEAQGATRLARGLTFYHRAGEAAARLQVDLAWRLEHVPTGVHSDGSMAPASAAAMFGP